MINSNKLKRFATLALLLCLISGWAMAERVSKDNVVVDYEVLADGSYKVVDVYNNSSNRIFLYIDDVQVTINAASSAKVNKISKHRVYFDSKYGGQTLLKYTPPSPPKVEEELPLQEVEEENQEVVNTNVSSSREANSYAPRQDRGANSLVAIDRINKDSFFGTDAVNYYVQKATSLADALLKSENKPQFILDNDIDKFLKDSKTELETNKNEIYVIAQEAVSASKIADSDTQLKILDGLISILNDRYAQRQSAYDKLKSAVDSIPKPADSGNDQSLKETIINYSIVGAMVLVLAIWMIVVVRKKRSKSKRQAATAQTQYEEDPNNPSIVIRRRTTSILKKQSIDDVINNPEYLLINTSEFTHDSAVRNIYIKNTCIKEVYNLYAEDLRNSDNPKEDGCMVLGRWVHNEDSNTYDISLESVVFPGDDAVFKEYELNFGGKIKLRVAEKLRKLRRETNLQYDLVCWIHSHPGLGVFFSNSDDNVQMQLKHSQHPYFLIAFVVDILTSDQEMGIFTFRKDGSMNSKGDLTKMYSLEDMYKWALESDKASFNPENYHNILASAKMQVPTCKGIELNNSSIIDLTQIVIEPATGIVGWAVGTAIEANGGKEYVVTSIVKAGEKPSAGVIGVLLNVTHMSLPTIQRLIANEDVRPAFILVHSTKLNTLTSIPVINGELITDEHFYGEETIDDLKIWTRRKR